MRKVFNITSPHGFRIRRPQLMPSVAYRGIHIVRAYEVRDMLNTVSSVIFETQCDMGKMNNEIDGQATTQSRFSNYRDRSSLEIASNIPTDLYDKEVLILKINQCLIDPETFDMEDENEPDVIYPGHVVIGLFRIDKNTPELEHYENSLISKVFNGLESDSKILNSQLFFSKKRSDNALKNGSKEYFWIISLEKLLLTKTEFLNRCLSLKESTREYHLFKSSCGHAVYQACTGRTLIKPKISPQTAARLAILEILSKEDEVFSHNLRNILIQSALTKNAYILGKQFLEESAATEDDSHPLPRSP